MADPQTTTKSTRNYLLVLGQVLVIAFMFGIVLGRLARVESKIDTLLATECAAVPSEGRDGR